MADPTAQELEEFEFRKRFEQEQGAATAATPSAPKTSSAITDWIGPEFVAGSVGAATGAITGPGIKKEIEKYGLPGLPKGTVTVSSPPPVAPTTSSIISTPSSAYATPEVVSSHGFHPGAATNAEFNEQQRLANQLQKSLHDNPAPGFEIEGNRRIITPEKSPAEKLAMERAALREQQLSETGQIAAKKYLAEKAAEAAVKSSGESNLSKPLQAARRGIENVGEFANRVISPGYSQLGTRALGALGGYDVGVQSTEALRHILSGEIGRGVVSGLGALGGAAALTRHPLLMPLGMGAAIAAPYVNQYLEGVAAKHPGLHMAEGGQPTVNVSAITPPNMSGMPGVGYMQMPQSAMLRAQLEHELENQARLRASATGMGMAIPGQHGVKMMPGNIEAGVNIPVGQGNVDISGYRSINPVNTPISSGHMHGANVRYTLPFAEGGGVAPYGFRHVENTDDVSLPKGSGWFGHLPNQAGGISTEISADSNGSQYPLLNPMMNRQEINSLLANEQPTDEMYRKAEQFARYRQAQGKSPFISPVGEMHWPLPKK